MELLETINTAWNWLRVEATEVLEINKFGNLLFQSKDLSIWRVCPEELYCIKISNSTSEFLRVKSEPEFIEDWEMTKFVNLGEAKFGVQKENRVFCFKQPTALGGAYDAENIGTISLIELISFSGDLAFQIKDVKDGQKVKLTTIHGK